jgi:5-methylcytosine-specific restriction endonuclease McrA
VVFVLDRYKRPLMPCSEKRARLLLQRGRARVHRLYPFTIRLVDRVVRDSGIQPVVLKIDYGSKASGFAVAREETSTEGPIHHALHLAVVRHRGEEVRERMRQRAQHRSRRRSANLRHRPRRFDNRRRLDGWLPPSLHSRVRNILTWARRYMRLAPITRVDIELAKFDTQKLQNPEISGVEYQRGELFGYEVREYLLEKWGRRCAYCGATDVLLEVDHIVPKSRGGTERVSNLTLACSACNRAKGDRTAEEFGHPEVQARAAAPLRDAAAVNATRRAVYHGLRRMGVDVRTWTGGQTKWNRERFGLPKSHTTDALCVGDVAQVTGWNLPVLGIHALGRGRRRRTNLDAHGFPRGYLPRTKNVFGFRTGDMVIAQVPAGKYAGRYVGVVQVRSSGRFDIKDLHGRRVAQGIHWQCCQVVQRLDGYSYGKEDAAPSSPQLKLGASGAANKRR